MIEVENLHRRYGDFAAVAGVSFEVHEGEIVGILGPNGAGKTTTIRMITGFLPPSSGKVRVYGHDLFNEPGRARRDIGYLPENVALYPEMRVAEYLAYRARLEGLSRLEARQAIGEAIERCLLLEVRDQIIATLSKGYRQRVGLATAILHRPRVLVLDEPTVGLDPKQIIAIRDLIRDLGRRHTLLLSTHILPEVELLCGRVLIIDRGRIVGQGTPQDLRDRWVGNAAVTVTLLGAVPEAEPVLAAIPGVTAVRAGAAATDATVWTVESETGRDPRADIFRAVVGADWTLIGLTQEKASLEDVFVRLTTHDDSTPEALLDQLDEELNAGVAS